MYILTWRLAGGVKKTGTFSSGVGGIGRVVPPPAMAAAPTVIGVAAAEVTEEAEGAGAGAGGAVGGGGGGGGRGGTVIEDMGCGTGEEEAEMSLPWY